MKLDTKTALSFISATFIFLACSTSSYSAEVIRIAHSDSIHHPKHLTFVKFSEIVKKRSKGELIVKIFPSGQLGDEREIIESLQPGVVHITAVSNGAAAAFSKQFLMLDIPYLFNSTKTARQSLNGDTKKIVFSHLNQLGIKLKFLFKMVKKIHNINTI